VAFENRYFPHLLPYDIPLWKAFLDKHADEYIKFEYDIRVGQGSSPPPSLDPEMQQMWRDLSTKRIDAIGIKPDSIEIIEITRRAGIKAVGQLTVYPLLYAHTYAPLLPLVPHLVTSELISDIETVLITNNIKTTIIPGYSDVTGISGEKT